MQQLNFYIGNPGVLVPQPMNWQSIEIELSFENDSPDAVLNTSKLIWVGDNASLLNQIFQGGLSGGNGIFVGVPLRITICSTGDTVFDGIIDLTDPETAWSCDKVEAKIVNYQIDLFNSLVDSISWAYLLEPSANNTGGAPLGPWTIHPLTDYVAVRYQRNDVPNAASLMQDALMVYNIFEQAQQIIKIGGKIGAAIAAAALPPFAVAVAVVEVIGMVLEIILLVLLIIAEISAIFTSLIPPIYHKLGMYVSTLFEKACDYFGFGFESTILLGPNSPFTQLVHLPVKQAWPTNSSLLVSLLPGLSGQNAKMYDDAVNYSTSSQLAYGFPDGTPGDFFRQMEDVFNAKCKIIIDSNGKPVMHFERWDFQYLLASYTLPNINSQAPFAANEPLSMYNPFTTNAADVPANYEIDWQTDSQDANTLDNYLGTSAYCNTSALTPIPAGQYSTLVNLVEKDFSFAMATRKDDFTIAENLFIDVLDIVLFPVNAVISIIQSVDSVLNGFPFNAGITPPNTINPNNFFVQSGPMLLSSDVTSSPKLMLTVKNGITSGNGVNIYGSCGFQEVDIDANNRGGNNNSGGPTSALPNLSARSLMKYFHFSSLPLTVTPPAFPFTPCNGSNVPNQTIFNQWIIFKNQTIPMCCAEYDLIKNNNYINTYDGQVARVDSLKYNPYKGTAQLDYRIRRQFTNNLSASFVIDGVTTIQTL